MKILSFSKGFYKVQDKAGVKTNISEKKLEELKKQKVKIIDVREEVLEAKQAKKESKQDKSQAKKESKQDDFSNLDEASLLEIAKRLGFQKDEASKEELIKFISDNK
jgi:hypothetical protein